MNSDWVKFLLIAVVAMAICLGGIGGWLLPQLGIENPAVARAIGGAIGGVIIAICYQKMILKKA
jgi:hypothetical protein